MATLQTLESLEYYSNYKLQKDELDLSCYLLDQENLEKKIETGEIVTPTVLTEIQRKKGQGPKDPTSRNTLPFPPRRRKEEIFDAAKYTAMDEYAKSLLPHPTETYSDFAARLFKKCSSNLDKVRAAFYFVCTADVDSMTQVAEETSEYAEIRSLSNQGGYYPIKVFSNLLQRGRVPFKEINGRRKGAGNEPGIETQPSGCRWFACYVDGEWRLVDPHWGSQGVAGFDAGNFAQVDAAGNVGGVQSVEGQHLRICNEFYFLTDPDKLIWTHFPNQREWQLLARPLTLEEFQKLPKFFSRCQGSSDGFNIMPQSHPFDVILAAPGTLEIFLRETGDETYQYKTQIAIHKDSINSEARAAIKDQADVKGYLTKTARMSKKEVKFKFVPPCIGKFRLTISAERRIDFPEIGKYRIIKADFISYVIHCPRVDKNAKMVPVGTNKLEEFGPGQALIDAGLITNLPGEMKIPDGEKQLELETTDHRRHPLSFQLTNAANDDLSSRHLLMWNVGTKIFVIFLSPDSGQFALVVLDSGRPVCQFLLEAPSEFRDSRFALPDVQRLGGLGIFDNDLGRCIRPASHPNPYVVCEEETLELRFSMEVRVEVGVELFRFDDNGQEVAADGFAFVNGSRLGFNVDVRFQLAGHYWVRMNARHSRSESWSHCGNYFVRSLGQPDGSAQQFPEPREAWSSDFRVVQPQQRVLPINESVPFGINCSDNDVTRMYIESGSERSLMHKDNSGLWRGNVKGYRNSAGNPVKVVAARGGSNECEELLEYRFETREDTNIQNQNQQRADELNKDRADDEQRRQRKQENYNRGTQGLELLPADPVEEERQRLLAEQEAEQRRREMEEERQRERERRRREQEEEQRRRERERRRREEEKQRLKEEEDRREAEEAERRRKEEERRKIEERWERQEAANRRRREAAEADRANRATTRQDRQRQMEAEEQQRKEQKRQLRKEKAARKQERQEKARREQEKAIEAESRRDQLCLSLHRNPNGNSQQLDELVKSIRELGDSSDSEDEALLLYTERTKEAVEYREELGKEMKQVKKSKSVADLKNLISRIESKGFSKEIEPKLQPELNQARDLVKQQERRSRASQRRQHQPRVELSKKSLTELSARNYVRENTKNIVQAALLLLGHCEMETESWKRARNALKKGSGQLTSVQPEDVDPAIAARARQLLEFVDKDDLSGIEVSLYDWVLDLTSEVKAHGRCSPAVGKRQRKLLGVSSGDVEDWDWEDRRASSTSR